MKEAEAARTQFADALLEMGAHAVGVENGGPERGWELVAYVEPTHPIAAPTTVKANIDKNWVDVPLRILRADAFKPG